MSFKYDVREMQEKDLDKVTALEAACFSMPWKYQDFKDILTNPDRIYLVAASKDADGDEILGGCMLTNIAGEGDISNVAVYEKYRNNSIATQLLTNLLELGTEQYGISSFTLEVRSQNAAARRLYEKFGFLSEGIRPNFYERPKDDAVIMWKRNEGKGD